MSDATFWFVVLGSPAPKRRPFTSTRVRWGPSPRRSTVETPPVEVKGPDDVLRQRVDQIRDVGVALQLDFLAADHGRRTRGRDIRRHRNAGAGDYDLLKLSLIR